MKRIATILGITALAASFTGTANADPFCIDFVNFCDGMLLTVNAEGSISGEWRNLDCAGSTAPVHGTQSDGLITVTCTNQATCPVGLVWKFNFDTSTNIFDMFGYDRVNPPFPQQVNQPFRIGRGTCPFGEGTGIPSTLHR